MVKSNDEFIVTSDPNLMVVITNGNNIGTIVSALARASLFTEKITSDVGFSIMDGGHSHTWARSRKKKTKAAGIKRESKKNRNRKK